MGWLEWGYGNVHLRLRDIQVFLRFLKKDFNSLLLSSASIPPVTSG